ncbi:MAG: 50S ribosomal protein L37e [Candidatus Altiarchaeales archaeon]|nr:50S ribosomal protein L37e [Candidatus Altiarchaeales archaeon]
MAKGTPSMGKRGKKRIHIKCPRCGHKSYHIRKKACAKCGFGRSTKRND